MKTTITLVIVFSVLIGLIILVLSTKNDRNNLQINEQAADTASPLTFDQATLYTCIDGSTIATAFKTNDTNIVEVSLPNVGPLVMKKDGAASETKYTTQTGYIFLEKLNSVTIEKDGETLYRECQAGKASEVVSTPQATTELVDTKWRWVETTFASGTPIVPNKPEDFSITFAPENRFSANTDCNNLGGGYATGPLAVLMFIDIISTSMACEGDTKEGEFILQLEQVSSYTLTNNELVMVITSMDTSGVMKFVKI